MPSNATTRLAWPWLALLVVLSTLLPVTGRADPADTEGGDSLDVFDSDVEHTRQGWSELYVALGGALFDADGSFSVVPPNRDPITIIDFDRVGLRETDSSYWLSVNWRSDHSRWGIWFASWRYDVTGSRGWEDELEFPGGAVIPVGATVESDFDARWYILEGTYSFYRSETLDAGVGFGLHTVDLDTTLKARFNVGEFEQEVVTGDLKTLAPLPNIMAYGYWKLHPRWTVTARLGWFGLDYDKYSGRMLNTHAMASYEVSSRWSLGLGYQLVDLELDVEDERLPEVYDIAFSGPMLFARFKF